MLEILSVNDPAFAEYGAVWTDVGAALTAAIAQALEEETPLPAATDYVPEDPAIQNLDTSRVKAFRVPAGQLVDIYGALSEYIGMCATNDTGTLLDIFTSAYERAGGAHLDITTADAMLVYLGVYTQDSILDVASSIVIDRLGRIWRELVMENRPEDERRLEPKVLLAGGVDILLTHAPARGVGDLDDRPHQGFACFNEAIGHWRGTLLNAETLSRDPAGQGRSYAVDWD